MLVCIKNMLVHGLHHCYFNFIGFTSMFQNHLVVVIGNTNSTGDTLLHFE